MSSYVQNFVKGAKGLKLKELVPYTQKFYGENLTYNKISPQVQQGVDSYTKKYIDTGSITPLVQYMWGIFFVAYAISWPGEYRHMKAEQAAKLKGEEGHH